MADKEDWTSISCESGARQPVNEARIIQRRVRFHAVRRPIGGDDNPREKRSDGRIPRVAKLLALAIRIYRCPEERVYPGMVWIREPSQTVSATELTS